MRAAKFGNCAKASVGECLQEARHDYRVVADGVDDASCEIKELLFVFGGVDCRPSLRCHVRVDRIEWKATFDCLQKLIKQRRVMFWREAFDSLDEGVVAVDAVCDATPNDVTVPRVDYPVIAGATTAEGVHPAAAVCDARDDLSKTIPEYFRRVGSRFLDVEAPEMVEPIADIDAYTRELCEFFLADEAKPGAPGY